MNEHAANPTNKSKKNPPTEAPKPLKTDVITRFVAINQWFCFFSKDLTTTFI